jgi:hypothetical protein
MADKMIDTGKFPGPPLKDTPAFLHGPGCGWSSQSEIELEIPAKIPLLIFEGEPFVTSEIRERFPNARVQNYQERDSAGNLFYSIHGKFALVPDPQHPEIGYFVGEEIIDGR